MKGTVQIDEAYVGGKEAGVPGRGAETKALVVVAVEVIQYEDESGRGGRRGHERDRPPSKSATGKGVMRTRAGRVRTAVIPNASAETLIPWVRANVSKEATIVTDGWASYSSLHRLGYTHTVLKQSSKGKKTGDYLPMIHLIISNLKRWLIGTHKGAVQPKHLQAYLNEFAFRFNRRFWRGPAFLRALELAVEAPHGHPEYRTLYAAGGADGWEHPGAADGSRRAGWRRVSGGGVNGYGTEVGAE